MKRISVAMATFDGERFLAEQLASLARQTVLPSELVVHDDGSSDGTLDVVAGFAGESPFPVRVERGERRLGFADAFLAAAGSCSGELIAFCDQDDVWLPEKLARCGEAFADPKVLVAIHSSRIVDDRLVPTGDAYPRVRASHVAPPLTADPWLAVRGMSMVVDARLVRLADPTRRPPSHYLADTPMHHDEWLYALGRGLGAVAFLAEPLALYRQHGANITGVPGGRAARVRETLTTGWTYYARRRDQARELQALFDGLATSLDDAELARRAAAASRSLDELARRLDRRLGVYEPGLPRIRRVRRLAHLARAGDYRRLGVGALARDAVMVALGRHG
jgi:glycosyltransferase involved in cell wall biosynthesis